MLTKKEVSDPKNVTATMVTVGSRGGFQLHDVDGFFDLLQLSRGRPFYVRIGRVRYYASGKSTGTVSNAT